VRGQGLGARLISAAASLTRERGRSWLRLDCDRDNPGLRAYYEGLGFDHAGDVENIPPPAGVGVPVRLPLPAAGLRNTKAGPER
jgi:ribosomal protein S18 acetylase RimI-like enzyme